MLGSSRDDHDHEGSILPDTSEQSASAERRQAGVIDSQDDGSNHTRTNTEEQGSEDEWHRDRKSVV